MVSVHQRRSNEKKWKRRNKEFKEIPEKLRAEKKNELKRKGN